MAWQAVETHLTLTNFLHNQNVHFLHVHNIHVRHLHETARAESLDKNLLREPKSMPASDSKRRTGWGASCR